MLRVSKNPALVDDLKAGNVTSAHLGAPERAMLDYTAKLTRDPRQVTADDIAALRTQGFSDEAILEMNAVAAYAAFINRLSLGLGLEIESSRK